MSHFAVLVKVSPEKLAQHEGDVRAAVESLLAPYQENNMGDCPRDFMQFNEMTEEIEESCKDVITSDSHFGKENPQSVGKTVFEHYGSFDLVATKYCGYKLDEETGKYGYWENPNRKWDWWQIGGRWAGWLPQKTNLPEDNVRIAAYYMWQDAGSPSSDGMEFYYKAEKELRKVYADEKVLRGSPSLLMQGFEYQEDYGDVIALKNIDFDKLNSDSQKELEDFYQKYLRWKALLNDPSLEKTQDDTWLNFDVPHTLFKLGARKIVKEREPILDENNQPVLDENGTPRFTDPVFEDRELTLEILQSEYKWNWEFSTFAVVDSDGKWHEKGEMGWFGCSTDTEEDRQNWSRSFHDSFIKNENPETLFVIVDCHI